MAALVTLWMLKELGLATPFLLSVYTALCAYALRALLGGRKSAPARLAATGFVALCLFLWWAPFTSRQAFFRDFHLLRPGMTVAQVQARMSGYPWRYAHFPGLRYRSPLPDDPPDEIVFLHSIDGAYEHNVDSGRVRFMNGRVAEVRVALD